MEPTNSDIARFLSRSADLMELHDENPFKVRSYRQAAATVEDVPTSLAAVAGEGGSAELQKLPGVGKTIGGQIAEFCASGTSAAFERLREHVPETVLEVMAVRGVGPKMAATLHREFGILDLEDLRRFAEGGGFEAVPGLGDRSAARLVSAVAAASKEVSRVPLAEAERAACALAAGLAAARPDAEVLVAGEVRRRCAAVARIDLLAVVADDAAGATAAFARLGDARVRTESRAVVATPIGLEAELHTAPPAARAVALVRATGSRRHVRQLEERAEEAGLALGRDGLAEGGERVPLGSEAELYARLGLRYVEPPERDGVDEVRLL